MKLKNIYYFLYMYAWTCINTCNNNISRNKNGHIDIDTSSLFLLGLELIKIQQYYQKCQMSLTLSIHFCSLTRSYNSLGKTVWTDPEKKFPRGGDPRMNCITQRERKKPFDLCFESLYQKGPRRWDCLEHTTKNDKCSYLGNLLLWS